MDHLGRLIRERHLRDRELTCRQGPPYSLKRLYFSPILRYVYPMCIDTISFCSFRFMCILFMSNFYHVYSTPFNRFDSLCWEEVYSVNTNNVNCCHHHLIRQIIITEVQTSYFQSKVSQSSFHCNSNDAKSLLSRATASYYQYDAPKR